MALKSHAGKTIVLPLCSGMGESLAWYIGQALKTGELIAKAKGLTDTFTAVDYERLAGHEG